MNGPAVVLFASVWYLGAFSLGCLLFRFLKVAGRRVSLLTRWTVTRLSRGAA